MKRKKYERGNELKSKTNKKKSSALEGEKEIPHLEIKQKNKEFCNLVWLSKCNKDWLIRPKGENNSRRFQTPRYRNLVAASMGYYDAEDYNASRYYDAKRFTTHQLSTIIHDLQ